MSPSTPLPPPTLLPPLQCRPTHSTPPPPPPSGPEPPKADEPAVAMWLAVLGSGLVATAALIVGFAGRDTLGAAGPAAGLSGAAAATLFSSRRLRAAAPTVADVLAHLSRLVAAVAVAAGSAAVLPWPWVTAVFGVTVGIATVGWTLGGRWARGVLHTLATGSVLVTVAATTVLPLGPLVAFAALALILAPPRRWRDGCETASVLLGLVALAAPLGGLPGQWRVGPGTLARLGLRGEVLAWSAPIAALVGGAAVILWSYRRRQPVLIPIAFAGITANFLVAIGSGEWPRWLPTIGLAVVFVAVQAVAAVLATDPFWRRSLVPAARAIALAALPVVAIWAIGTSTTVALDGGDVLAAIAPVLLAVGFALVPAIPLERVVTSSASGAMLLVATFVATASLTSTALIAVGLLAFSVAGRPSSPPTSICAVTAWGLSFGAQLTSAPVLPTALSGATLVLIGFAIGRRAAAGYVLAIVVGAIASGMAAFVPAGSEALLAAAIAGGGLAATALVAARRSDMATALVIPGQLCALAVLDFLGESDATGVLVRGHAGTAAAAGAAVAAIGAAGWWRGERWAGHLAACGAAWAVAVAGVALGAPLPWVVGGALLIGVALAGAAFSRPRYGVVDTAAMAMLFSAFVLGVSPDAGPVTLAWSAMVALGSVVTLHGLSRLDAVLTSAGAVLTTLSAGSLMHVAGGDRWVVELAARAGMSPADMATAAVVLLLAGAGAALARLRRATSSWWTWGPAAFVTASYLLVTIAASPHPDVRLLVALTVGVLLVVAGAWRRVAAPLVIGTLTVTGSIGLASLTTLRSLPAWVWMAVGGAALLAVAALLERRGRGGDATHAVKQVLTTFR
jgi:hypothetical protein